MKNRQTGFTAGQVGLATVFIMSATGEQSKLTGFRHRRNARQIFELRAGGIREYAEKALTAFYGITR